MKAAGRIRFVLLAAALGLLFACGGHMPRIVVVKDSLSPEERLNLGVAYEARGEYEAAVEQYEQAAAGPGLKGLALLYKGNALLRMGKTTQAEEAYRNAIKADSSLAGAYNNLAWLYCSSGGNLEEAERLAERAFELTGGKDSNVIDTLGAVRAALRGQTDASGKLPCAP